jgi:hypothetical protein
LPPQLAIGDLVIAIFPSIIAQLLRHLNSHRGYAQSLADLHETAHPDKERLRVAQEEPMSNSAITRVLAK